MKYFILFSCICHYLLIIITNYFYSINNENNNYITNNYKNINVSLNIIKNNVEVPKLELQKTMQNNNKNNSIVKQNISNKKSKKVISNKISNDKNIQKNIQKIKQVKKENWQQQIKKQFSKLKKQQLFYPIVAIQNNIQGIVEVKILLDNNGNVMVCRIENSSGYEILDIAALKAVKTLKSLEENAPREFILPVRFSLN